MSEEKFVKDMKTLLSFIQLYCKDKHKEYKKQTKDLTLVCTKNELENITYSLCEECEENFLYSYKRLQKCPHDPKPRCRHCEKPCYAKPKWKSLTAIMKYSGMKMGLIKIKNIFMKKKRLDA